MKTIPEHPLTPEERELAQLIGRQGPQGEPPRRWTPASSLPRTPPWPARPPASPNRAGGGDRPGGIGVFAVGMPGHFARCTDRGRVTRAGCRFGARV